MAKKMVDECASDDDMDDVSMVNSVTIYGNLKVSIISQ